MKSCVSEFLSRSVVHLCRTDRFFFSFYYYIYIFFYLRVGFIVKLLRSDPPAHQVIPHGVCQGKVIVPGRGDVPVLYQGEVQVAVEALLQLRHVLHLHDAPDADLLALLLVGQRRRHGAPGSAGFVHGNK